MRDEVRHAILWTVACSLLFFWFFTLAVRSLVVPPNYVQKVKHVTTCRPGTYRGLP